METYNHKDYSVFILEEKIKMWKEKAALYQKKKNPVGKDRALLMKGVYERMLQEKLRAEKPARGKKEKREVYLQGDFFAAM